MTRIKLWRTLIVVAIALCTILVIYPVYVIRPFRAQGPQELALALTVLRYRSIALLLCIAVTLIAAVRAWPQTTSRWGRIAVGASVLSVLVLGALSRVNIYEQMFHPMSKPAFIPIASAKVDGSDKVIAVKLNNESRGYPVRTLAYHHLVNDVLGRQPIVATY